MTGTPDAARLFALDEHDSNLNPDLNLEPEQAYGDIVLLAAQVCDTPVAAVSFLDGERQWFKAEVGLGLRSVAQDGSFCVYTLAERACLVVPDARRDVRFEGHPLVAGEPQLRFYAGVPLVTAAGAVGTLCVMDHAPRELNSEQEEALQALARQVMRQLELRRTALQLEESEQRFEALMDNSPVVTFIKDEAGRMVYANKPFERRFRLGRRQWQHKNDLELWPAEVARSLREHDLSVLQGEETVELLESVPTPDGGMQHWQVYKFPLRLGGRKFVGGAALDVTDMKRYEEQLEAYGEKLAADNLHLNRLGRTDALTGLKNRRAFDEALAKALAHARRHGEALSLLLLDVDQFKAYNDTFGHPAGDDALRQVGRLLSVKTRSGDFIARYGGEEFAAILPDTILRDALALAERFRLAVKTSSWERRDVTVSIGAATLTPATTDPRALVAAADKALYRAKEQGRNRVVSFGQPPLTREQL